MVRSWCRGCINSLHLPEGRLLHLVYSAALAHPTPPSRLWHAPSMCPHFVSPESIAWSLRREKFGARLASYWTEYLVTQARLTRYAVTSCLISYSRLARLFDWVLVCFQRPVDIEPMFGPHARAYCARNWNAVRSAAVLLLEV